MAPRRGSRRRAKLKNMYLAKIATKSKLPNRNTALVSSSMTCSAHVRAERARHTCGKKLGRLLKTRGRLFKTLGRLLKKTRQAEPKTHTHTQKTTTKNQTMIWFLRPQTDFVRLVSSKLILRGVPVVRESRFNRFYEKTPPKKEQLQVALSRMFAKLCFY